MIDVTKWGKVVRTSGPIGPLDTAIPLPLGRATEFAPAPGGYYYLTLRTPGKMEVVKVVGLEGNKLLVQRGQDHTSSYTWPGGSCMEFDWNPSQLCEFVSACGRVHNTGLTGTYCIDCGSCMELQQGLITAIDGATPCSHP